MKTRILSIFFFLVTSGLCNNINAIETAGQIVAKCVEAINKAPSISIKFTLSYGNNKSNCELLIEHDKYCLTSDDLKIWYDGMTQWTLNQAENEVSITEPTFEELLESNPFAIINNYSSSYSIRRLSGIKPEVEFVAKSKMANIRKAVVSFDEHTNMPTKLIVTMSNGRTFSASVLSTSKGKTLPSSTFTFNSKNYPSTNIVDLR